MLKPTNWVLLKQLWPGFTDWASTKPGLGHSLKTCLRKTLLICTLIQNKGTDKYYDQSVYLS